jgi:hypothetical protein
MSGLWVAGHCLVWKRPTGKPGVTQIGCAHCQLVTNEWVETELSEEVVEQKVGESQAAHASRCAIFRCRGAA